MKKQTKIVVLSGAGVSAESGLKTFRDSDGLWEGHSIEDVATPQGWQRDRELVLDFYNQRRKDAQHALPNDGHRALADLEKHFDVQIITQNVDNLHERAGSSKVLHLHGELFKVRSTRHEDLVYDLDGWELKTGDLCAKGHQLRPHIVWFGEAVPLIEPAAELASQADIFIVVGTSLVVYPAAGLVDYVPNSVPIYVIDPHKPDVRARKNMVFIEQKATVGLRELANKLITGL